MIVIMDNFFSTSKTACLALLAASALAFAGCGAHEPADHDHAHDHDHGKAHESTHTVENAKPLEGKTDSLNVQASIYPLQFLVERIAGEKAKVTSLTGPGVDAHSLELSPKVVAELGQADAVIYLAGFQSAVDEATEQSENPRILDISHAVSLIEGHAHDHAHDHNAKEKETADHDHKDDHEHEMGLDPHFWLDPNGMAKAAHNVAEFFAKIDAANAETYYANAEKLESELKHLADELKNGLAKCEIKTFVVSHEAFGYLAKQTGLEQVGVSGLDPEVAPSVARVEEVKKVVAEKGVKTIYLEVNVSPRVLEALAADLGVEVAVLDPIATLNDPSSDYLKLMRKNLETLQKGQNCQ